MAEWTSETLLAHINALMESERRSNAQRFADQERAVEAALKAAKEAVLKAETAAEKRFEGVNEFRETLADQQRTLMPRAEAELRFDALDRRQTTVSTALNEKMDAVGKGLDSKVAALSLQVAQVTGQKTGHRETWAYIVAAVGVLLAVLSFVLGR